jgi:two-component system response regulator YesN
MSRKRTWSVLIAEDESLIRRHLARKPAENCPAFEVVGEAADGQEALEAVAELYPDVLVTDIRMPMMDGLQLTREVYDAFPDFRVVIVSGYDEFSYAKTALALGVKDYLLKPVTEEELRSVMSRLAIQLDAEEKRLDGEHPDVSESASQEELVSAVKEYLRAHFAEAISLAELAARFHVNPPYLTRVFKRHGGVAPVRCLRDLRISHARKLLGERPSLEIKEIAAMVGCPDQGYFSRVFKQAVGTGPQEYRACRGTTAEAAPRLGGRPTAPRQSTMVER